MRIFIIAYACEPNRQSEPGLGWNISGEVAGRHNVTVLTRANNRKSIEHYLASNPTAPQSKIKFVYFDKGGVLQRLKKRIPFGDQIYFSSWLKTATRAYAKEFVDYDIVHQLTFSPFFIKPWGAVYTKRYVWGPIGGGGGTDARFPKGFKVGCFGDGIREWLYRVMAWLCYNPLAWHFKNIRRRVAAVTFKAKAFSKGFPIAPGQISAVVQETGYAGVFPVRLYDSKKHPLMIVAVGRMIPHKGFEYAIKGFLRFLADGGEGEFHIFGDGPLRARLESIADGKVVFHGNVPNSRIHVALDGSDVFLHGSFIEAAAWSILEAMVHGVPVVCQDRSGMADMVTDDCGIKVAAMTPEELVSGFAAALTTYYWTPDLIRQHGENGQNRVRNNYTWSKCGDLLDDVYGKVTDR